MNRNFLLHPPFILILTLTLGLTSIETLAHSGYKESREPKNRRQNIGDDYDSNSRRRKDLKCFSYTQLDAGGGHESAVDAMRCIKNTEKTITSCPGPSSKGREAADPPEWTACGSYRLKKMAKVPPGLSDCVSREIVPETKKRQGGQV